MTKPKTGKEESVKIPKWFIVTMFFLITTFGAWAHSITIKLNVMAVQLDRSLEAEGNLKEHASNHVSKSMLAELGRRIEKLEKD